MAEYVTFPFWKVNIVNGLILSGLFMLYTPETTQNLLIGLLLICVAALLGLIISRPPPNSIPPAETPEVPAGESLTLS